MIKKIQKILTQLFSRYPSDRRVKAVIHALLPCAVKHQPTKVDCVAIQGVEDPLFFSLFAALLIDIRKYGPLKADLIQIRSINGAVGVRLRAKFFRSWIIASLFNYQWGRANKNLVGEVAYKSQPVFWNLGRRKDRMEAEHLWIQMKVLEAPEQLNMQDIKIGDLVIDSYLRFRPSAQFKIEDPFVLTILQQAIRDIRLAKSYFEEKRPKLYISSYSTYIEHGIPVRVALSLGIPVRTYGNLITFGKRLSREDFFHTVDTSKYRKEFEAFSYEEKRLAIKLAETSLNIRLSGGIDTATSYMKVSAYAHSEEVIPDVNGSVVIFLHDFYDSPHIYPDLVFTDFWAWISFTINTLSNGGIPFWLKPHPNQISENDGVLADLRDLFPQARFLSSKITNKDLAGAGILGGVTVYGTVAHELAYYGIPSVACARHPHVEFDFCETAKTLEEYGQMLLNSGASSLSYGDMRQQALVFYYMHNLGGDLKVQELKKAFVNFWKLWDKKNLDLKSLIDALQYLRSLPGWSEHILEIQSDF